MIDCSESKTKHSPLSIEVASSLIWSERESKEFTKDPLHNYVNLNETSTQPSIVSFPITRIERLGQGCSSVVYKSVLLNSLKVCAEKVFVASDPNKKVQLYRELESLKLAFDTKTKSNGDKNSAYIVSPLELFSNPYDGTLSLCLEYMDGGSLQDIVKVGGCRNEVILASIAYQMLCGLSFLHGLRLIHRDLKPGNVLVSSSGRVKLADFGLARSLDLGHSLADSFVGTFDYMAPERLTGEAYSLQSDIWSYGLTLHTVALGRYPYRAHNKGYWELLHATNEDAVPLPPSDQFSDQFIDFIRSACQKDMRSRPTASELLTHPFLSSRLSDVPSEFLVGRKKQKTAGKTAKNDHAGDKTPSGVFKPQYLGSTAPTNNDQNNNHKKLNSEGNLSLPSGSGFTSAATGMVATPRESSSSKISQPPLPAHSTQKQSLSNGVDSSSHHSTYEECPTVSNRVRSSIQQSGTAVISAHALDGPNGDYASSKSSGAVELTTKDLYKLVRSWKSFVVHAKLEAAHSTATTPLDSGAKSTKNISRLPAENIFHTAGAQKSQQEQQYFVTEEVVTTLARDLGCDAELLKHCFKHALLDMRRQFSSGAVQTISGRDRIARGQDEILIGESAEGKDRAAASSRGNAAAEDKQSAVPVDARSVVFGGAAAVRSSNNAADDKSGDSTKHESRQLSDSLSDSKAGTLRTNVTNITAIGVKDIAPSSDDLEDTVKFGHSRAQGKSMSSSTGVALKNLKSDDKATADGCAASREALFSDRSIDNFIIPPPAENRASKTDTTTLQQNGVAESLESSAVYNLSNLRKVIVSYQQQVGSAEKSEKSATVDGSDGMTRLASGRRDCDANEYAAQNVAHGSFHSPANVDSEEEYPSDYESAEEEERGD